MTDLDWAVVCCYLVGMLVVGAAIGRRQQTRKGYYLGGQRMPAVALATSTIATQCSTNSLPGAPAFVGFVAGGGMVWLQYETGGSDYGLWPMLIGGTGVVVEKRLLGPLHRAVVVHDGAVLGHPGIGYLADDDRQIAAAPSSAMPSHAIILAQAFIRYMRGETSRSAGTRSGDTRNS